MPATSTALPLFVYGEQRDEMSERSLGYRLLEPVTPQRWSADVESLARWLQATPYPDHWPCAQLFCSILLPDQQRVVAVVRYGVCDSTASRRRGGIELLGVLTPTELDVTSALRIYRWLCARRETTDDVQQLGRSATLEQMLAEAPSEAAPPPLAVLPVRPAQDGCLIFGAAMPEAPDQHLNLLTGTTSKQWQWLPLCPGDFPFRSYAERGPLIAWTLNLVELALHLEKKSAPAAVRSSARRNWPALLLILLLAGLLAANLWALWTLPQRLEARTVPITEEAAFRETKQPQVSKAATDTSREEFAAALYRLVRDNGGKNRAAALTEEQLLARYRQLAEKNVQLRVAGRQAQALVGLVSILAPYDPDHIAQLIRQAIPATEGYDPRLIELISDRIRERLSAEMGKAR